MILYLVIAIAVFVYYSRSRDVAPWRRFCLALFWPLTFLVYLYNRMTGRPDRYPFIGPGRGPGGCGRGRGRRR